MTNDVKPSKYPDSIVDRVAEAIFEFMGYDDYGVMEEDGKADFREAAVKALDAAGLERQIKDAEYYKGPRQERYSTPWRNIYE